MIPILYYRVCVGGCTPPRHASRTSRMEYHSLRAEVLEASGIAQHWQKTKHTRVVPDSIGSVLHQTQLCFRCFLCFPISGFLDMRKLLPCTFQDFNFDILKSEHFSKNVEMLTCKLYIAIYIYIAIYAIYGHILQYIAIYAIIYAYI